MSVAYLTTSVTGMKPAGDFLLVEKTISTQGPLFRLLDRAFDRVFTELWTSNFPLV